MSAANLSERAKQGDTDAIAALLNQVLQAQNITTKVTIESPDLQVSLFATERADSPAAIAAIAEIIKNLQLPSIQRLTISWQPNEQDAPVWQQVFTLSEANFWQSAVQEVTQTHQKVMNSATQAGKAMVDTAAGLGVAAGKQTRQIFEQASESTGKAIAFLNHNPLLRYVTKLLRVDWLVGIIDRVDVVKAKAAVTQLQEKYPQEPPAQIAHRLMVEKSFYAGGMGLASSLVPGAGLATLGVDLMTTTLLQAEMVYQIAAAYGLDLADPARKGEVLAIFGIALGGDRALKAGLGALRTSPIMGKVGLGLLRATPIAGAVISASANAFMLYSLGYAACRFYEAQQNPLSSEETLAASQQENEAYQATAIAQQGILDQILIHVIVAGNPGKSWADILPELEPLQLSPASLEAIAAHLESPPPLEELLNQLNQDFAISLVAQCEKIAQINGETSPAEAKVIETIRQKLKVDFPEIKAVVERDRDAANRLSDPR